jgi:hypothetical protein
MESGATRNFEVYKEMGKTEEEAAADKEQEEKEDPMKALENRVLDSQKEMADMDNLEEIKAMNARHVKLMNGTGAADSNAEAQAVLQSLERKDVQAIEQDAALTAQDEALVKSIQFGQQQKLASSSSRDTIRRLDEQDELELERKRRQESAAMEERQREISQKVAAVKKSTMPVIKVKRKRTAEQAAAVGSKKTTVEPTPPSVGGLEGLLGGYGSDSESD